MLIKKQWYWPKHVPGDAIIAQFNNKDVGSTDTLYGMMDAAYL